jgi:hypothetical protein
MQIDSNLYGRQGKALTNFKDTLPSPTSDSAQQLFKMNIILSFKLKQREQNTAYLTDANLLEFLNTEQRPEFSL